MPLLAALALLFAGAATAFASSLSISQKLFCGYVGDDGSLSRGRVPEDRKWSREMIGECAATLFGVPGCNLNAPDAACARKVLSPLADAKAVPFDAAAVRRAYTPLGPYLGKTWRLTTMHRVPRKMFGKGDCALDAFRYGEAPFELSGCGRFLFAGGHPLIKNCPVSGAPYACIAAVPHRERPDIGLIEAPRGQGQLPVAALTSANEGEVVFIVHEPPLSWLGKSAAAEYARRGPLVSRGVLLEVAGTIAGVVAPTFDGSSGGTVLNRRGEVVGIVSHKTDGAPYAFVQTLNPRMIGIIRGAAQK
ncbi:MAG: trypsin-like peptidase domain-containing protein [Elusimicrobia bacterium]|nr:trypsin-like peptidase domain-containing protein [Elusimicrobiota bacterium]